MYLSSFGIARGTCSRLALFGVIGRGPFVWWNIERACGGLLAVSIFLEQKSRMKNGK